MITGRPKKPVILSKEVREQLGAIVNSRSSPHGLVRRARIVLLAADGISNNAIAKESALAIKWFATGVSAICNKD